MAPRAPLKTYTKRFIETRKKTIDSVNDLFVPGLKNRHKKRRKAKLCLKELPARTEPYKSENSLHVEPNNTFDRLLQGTIYNSVQLCSIVKINSSSEISKSTSVHRSPILTRSKSRSHSKITEIIDSKTPTRSLGSLITNSLCIEKEARNNLNLASLSYIKLPNENSEKSFLNIKPIYSSTPCRFHRKDENLSGSEIHPSFDWKLHNEPKVYLTNLEVQKDRTDWKLYQEPKVYLTNLQLSPEQHFKGFEQEDEKCETCHELQTYQLEDSIISISDDEDDSSVVLNHSKKIVLLDHSYSMQPILEEDESSITELQPTLVNLKPGKSYRRSLMLFRKSSFIIEGQPKNIRHSCRQTLLIPIRKNRSILNSFVRKSYAQEEIKNLDEDLRRKLSLNEVKSNNTTTTTKRISTVQNRKSLITAKDIVLRRCGQTGILSFQECYPETILQNCQKIGEGVYGEVFLYRSNQIEQNVCTTVMKVIPIEGDQNVNGEKQKKFEEILSEIIITCELSNLRDNRKNLTKCFTQVKSVKCVRGKYPERLIELWDLYEETKGSENDSPEIFTSNQLYVVLELANGGQDLESFVFNNAQQSYAMFQQAACALAVAETALKFEHRDLHWGNILISRVDKKANVSFRLNGKEIEVESFGIQISIIDFTLSRIEFDGVVIFNDLSQDDELFLAKGDYQFEIYRLMKEQNENKWQDFQPFSNVLWLHYILDKIKHLRYKTPRGKIHNEYLKKLEEFKNDILIYDSVTKFVQEKFF